MQHWLSDSSEQIAVRQRSNANRLTRQYWLCLSCLLNLADIVETTLLLVWRHLSYFLGRNENDGSSSDSLRPSADGRVATYRPQPLQGLLGDQQELKKRASKAFDLILEPLEGIQLVRGRLARPFPSCISEEGICGADFVGSVLR